MEYTVTLEEAEMEALLSLLKQKVANIGGDHPKIGPIVDAYTNLRTTKQRMESGFNSK